MNNKAISSLFVYVISALIVILILFFGYRAISSFYEANEDSTMERFQLKIKSDFTKLSTHYGTTALMSYDVARSYDKICFVDLTVSGAGAVERDTALESINPLIADNVEEVGVENIFAFGKNNFLAFNAGPMKVKCSPYIYCINLTRTRISFFAQGYGDSVIILGNNATTDCS